MPTGPDQEFLRRLYEEIIKTHELRAKYTLRKLSFVISLLGIGSIRADIGFTVILYIVPAIAIAFDLYIVGTDFNMKRLGTFLRENSLSEKEMEWEKYVNTRRDPFAPFAMLLLTVGITIICGIIITTREPSYVFLFFWFVVTTGSSIGLYLHNKKFRRKFGEEAESYLEEKRNG